MPVLDVKEVAGLMDDFERCSSPISTRKRSTSSTDW